MFYRLTVKNDYAIPVIANKALRCIFSSHNCTELSVGCLRSLIKLG